MRILMLFAIGFTIGCIPGSYFLWNDWYIVAGFAFFAGSVFLLTRKHNGIRKAALVILGLAVGLLWMWGYQEIHLKPARQVDGKTVAGTIEITDYSRKTDYGTSADGRIKIDGRSYRVYAYLQDTADLKPGDRVRGRFDLRLTTLGGQDEATYHQGKGIFLLAYADGAVQVKSCNAVPARYCAAKLRHDIKELLDKTFPEDAKGFAKALLLGDGTDLTYEDNTNFKVTGIRHVIAVSGLHISILCSFLYGLMGRQRVITPLVGIPLMILFAAVAGFTPSVTRACIMQCLIMLAVLLDKKYDPPTAIAFAVLVILVINPMAVTSVSLQLSVGCTVGIFLLGSRLSKYVLRLLRAPKDKSLRARISRWIAGTVGVTLSATAVTTPLSAFYFGTVSLIGILTNILALWVVSVVFYGIMLVCLFGAIWLPLGQGIGCVIAFLIRYILKISDLLAAIPYGAVYTCSIYIVLCLVFCYLLFLFMVCFRKKYPGVFLGCVTAALVAALFASWLEPRLDSFRVTVLDVGQGQAILLQSDDKTYLVDCGSSSESAAADTVAEYLLSQSVFRLDGLILTHYDIDHSGGVPLLMSRILVDRLYLPDMADDGDIKQFLRQNYSSRIRWIRNMDVIQHETSRITLIPGENNGAENENSLCVLFQAEKCDILITGDRNNTGERKLLNSFDLPELELLIAGHHGANTATGFELLSVTQPKAVAISVEKDNIYGHPSRELLERLEAFGCSVYRTDQQGTIIFGR